MLLLALWIESINKSEDTGALSAIEDKTVSLCKKQALYIKSLEKAKVSPCKYDSDSYLYA